MAKVFVIGDTHFPFHDNSALKQVLSLIKREKPTHVVQIGDLLDQYVFSKYTKTLKIEPEREIKEGLQLAGLMWDLVRQMAPKAKLIQVLGNHDLRLNKRIRDKFPELESFFGHKDLYKFPGVSVLQTDRDYIEIDGVVYTHGYLSKSLDHAIHFNKPVVHGHRHRAAIETKGKLWSMDVGYLADPSSLPLSYTPSTKSSWTHACGTVEEGVPRLILLKGKK